MTVEQIARSIPVAMLALTSKRLCGDVMAVYRCSHITAEAAVARARMILDPSCKYF